MPVGPTTVTRCGLESSVAWRHTERIRSSSRARPTNRPSVSGRSAGSEITRVASHVSTGLAFPFATDAGSCFVGDRVPGRAPGLGADDEPADGGGGLQPGRRVDDVPDRDGFARLRRDADDRLAGVHRRPGPEPRPERRHRIEHAKPGPHGPLGVVSVRDRRTEDRHHRIPDELLDVPAVRLDPLPGDRVVRAQGVADVLRVRVVRRRGEPLEVDEQDRDELPLLAGGRRALARSPASRAEARIRRELQTTTLAGDGAAMRLLVHPGSIPAPDGEVHDARPACDDQSQAASPASIPTL